jgi:hypothetical protein
MSANNKSFKLTRGAYAPSQLNSVVSSINMKLTLSILSLFFIGCMEILTEMHVDNQKLYSPINLINKNDLNTNTEHRFSAEFKYYGRYQIRASINRFSIDVDTSYTIILKLQILNDNKTIEKIDTVSISAETANTDFMFNVPNEAKPNKLTDFIVIVNLFSNGIEKQSCYTISLNAVRLGSFLR